MALPPAADDRTCVVTGASSGIGAEIAWELARRSLGVTLVARREDRLRKLAGELRDATGVRVEVLAADLADAKARGQIGDELAERGLTPSVLVNNAGIGTFGPVHQSEPDQDLTLLRTNVEAVAHLCGLFLPGMVERGSGAVLNVASTAAFQPLPGQAAYAASKSLVLSYSHAVRAETHGSGVTVTALCPGPVETEFSRAAGVEDEEFSNALPRFMWLSADKVARAGVKGLARGQAVVIPGLPNRATAFVGRHVPHRLVARLVARRHPAMRNR
jgi:short-subunit dehydrogenase